MGQGLSSAAASPSSPLWDGVSPGELPAGKSCACQPVGAPACANAAPRQMGLIRICVYFDNSASAVLPISATCMGAKCTFRTAPLPSPSQPLCSTLPVLPRAASDMLCSSTACTSTTHAPGTSSLHVRPSVQLLVLNTSSNHTA